MLGVFDDSQVIYSTLAMGVEGESSIKNLFYFFSFLCVRVYEANLYSEKMDLVRIASILVAMMESL